jgi:hypothetical protein
MGISGKVDGGTRGKSLMMPWYEQLLQRWPDFTITFLGVLLGAGFGFYIERKVAEWQLASQEKAEDLRERERLLAHLDRVKVEVRDNGQWVAKLQQDVLDKAATANDPARVQFFGWAAVLVDALSEAAYEDLVESGLHRRLSDNIQGALFDARQMVVGLKTMVKAGERAIQFHHFVGQSNAARNTAENCRKYAQTVFETLEEMKSEIYECANELRKTLPSKAA